MLSFLLAMASPAPVQLPSQPALTAAIARQDEAFFDIFFNRCQPDKLRAMLAVDVEFYHDKGGLLFTSADRMVEDYRKNCTARLAADAWRSRRELVRTSLHVDPVPGHGAIEAGEHLFFERQGSGPEKLVGRARFVIVWKLDGGAWKLSRALSFAHEAAAPK